MVDKEKLKLYEEEILPLAADALVEKFNNSGWYFFGSFLRCRNCLSEDCDRIEYKKRLKTHRKLSSLIDRGIISREYFLKLRG